MGSRIAMFSAVLAMTLVLPAMASADMTYEEVLTFAEIKGTGGSRAVYATVPDGDTAYNFLSLEDAGDTGRITKVVGVTGAKVYSELLSTVAWQAASGKTTMTPFYGTSLVAVGQDEFLQFGDSSTDCIWRVNVADGAVAKYVSAEQIQAYTGHASATMLLSASTPHPVSFEQYFYEGRTDSILRTTGAGTVETYVSSAQLTALTGNDSVSGGMSIDAAGDLYWVSNTSDAMYKWSAGAGSEVLSTAEINAVTGLDTAGFADVLCAPDGMVYFYESKSDGLMIFDPADPAGTLAYVLTEAELLAGPAGSDSVGQLAWYNDGIAWGAVSASVNGFYGNVVPEPATLTLLVLGGSAALLRRRR